MQKEIISYGSRLENLDCFPSSFSVGRDNMTAIAAAYDPSNMRFVIAADGRCAAPTLPLRVKTDEDQKVFDAHTRFARIMFAMSGAANIGSFELTGPVHRQIEMLSKRKFSNGYEFASTLCRNLIKVLHNALEDGRITDIRPREDLPPEEKGRLFTIYLVGFFQGVPFFRVSTFYFDESSRRFTLPRDQNPSLQNFHIIYTGSNKIQLMVTGKESIDPRLAHYLIEPNKKPDVRTATLSLVRACCDPNAKEIDADYWRYGGRIHAGELTPGGFTWIEPPINAATQSDDPA
jgi:hypothetical protein